MTDPASELQQSLIENGAQAQSIDSASLLAQIQALQAQVNALNAERGVPADPIEGAKQNLIAHVKAKIAQYPQADFSVLLKTLEELPEVLSPTHTELVKTLVEEVASVYRQLEVHYLPDLARDFHKVTLQKAAA